MSVKNLTPSNTVILENLIVAKNSTAITKHKCSLSCSQEPTTSPYPQRHESSPHIPRYILILFFPLHFCLPSFLYPSYLLDNIFGGLFQISPMHATCRSHILCDCLALTIFIEQCRQQRFPLRMFHLLPLTCLCRPSYSPQYPDLKHPKHMCLISNFTTTRTSDLTLNISFVYVLLTGRGRPSFTHVHNNQIMRGIRFLHRSQWPRCLRRCSSDWLLGSWVGCLSLCFCVMLSCVGRGLCDGLITYQRESCRVS
jgi:hypothetical protein